MGRVSRRSARAASLAPGSPPPEEGVHPSDGAWEAAALVDGELVRTRRKARSVAVLPRAELMPLFAAAPFGALRHGSGGVRSARQSHRAAQRRRLAARAERGAARAQSKGVARQKGACVVRSCALTLRQALIAAHPPRARAVACEAYGGVAGAARCGRCAVSAAAPQAQRTPPHAAAPRVACAGACRRRCAALAAALRLPSPCCVACRCCACCAALRRFRRRCRPGGAGHGRPRLARVGRRAGGGAGAAARSIRTRAAESGRRCVIVAARPCSLHCSAFPPPKIAWLTRVHRACVQCCLRCR